jgi:outer membrane receptor protein involved in Fe transport
MLEPLTVSLEVENLLNDAYEQSQGDIITRSYKTGISGLLGIKWRFDDF